MEYFNGKAKFVTAVIILFLFHLRGTYTQTSTQTYDNYTQTYENYTQTYDNYTQTYENYTQTYYNYTQTYDNYTQTYDNYTQTYDNYTQTYDNYTQTYDNDTRASNNVTGCGNVASIPNGHIVLVNSSDKTFGASAQVSCDDGYGVSTVVITCLYSGVWKNATCDLIGCGEVPDIAHGDIWIADATNTTFGVNGNVTCFRGYAASSDSIACLESGVWENATCDAIDEPFLENGEVLPDNDFGYGVTRNISCNQRYTPSTLSISCLHSGEWENVTCNLTGCGDVAIITNGEVWLENDTNTDIGSTAFLTCQHGYIASSDNTICLGTGDWEVVSCDPVDCGGVPLLEYGDIMLDDSTKSTLGATASVDCDLGRSSTITIIECLPYGNWSETSTCVMNECDISNIPEVANGGVTFDTNQITSSYVNVSCNSGYTATSPTIECLGQDEWQDDVACVSYALGAVQLIAGEVTTTEHTVFLRCAFAITDGLKYRLKWFALGSEFLDTGILTSTQASSFLVTDEMFETAISPILLQLLFGAQLTCSATVYDGDGTTELATGVSGGLVPIKVSSNYITLVRGEEATITVQLDLPFGCAPGTTDCKLKYVLYNPEDNAHDCGDSTIAVVSNDMCGGTVVGNTGQVSVITNITFTTIINRWYRLRSNFPLILKLVGEGNSKTIWNTPETQITVVVTENYATRYSGCYSFVDPYFLTFDGRWYAMQLINEYIMVKHTKLPIEIQTITALCNGDQTCSCAVTVRAGGDVFTINHCGNHITGYLSRKDGILKVYGQWATSYLIVLPTGMQVHVYVMPYLYYMMNVYVTPAPSDFGHLEGLCGNFNGDYSDDTILRGTNTLSSVETTPGFWWEWWDEFFYPHDFADSWAIGSEESLLVNYENVASWDSDTFLCVCPYASSQGNYQALCSADEEATCTTPISRHGTVVEGSTRSKRDVDGQASSRFTAKHLRKMRQKWIEAHPQHIVRKTGNTTEWVGSHCDAFTLEVTVELATDLDFAENNTEVATSITNNYCPGNCTGNGDCVKGICECHPDFATDLCILNITAAPLLQELADGGVCGVNTDPCDYITIVGSGFVEGVLCNVTVYGAGENGTFILTQEFEANCTYLNYNELLVPTSESATVSRRRRDVADTSNTTEIATMIGVSVSNDGTHFSEIQYVVILDATCQQTETNGNNENIVTLKSGYCYISGTCYTSGTFSANSACDKCDTSNSIFDWTDGCSTTDSSSKSNLTIILACVGSVLFVGVIAIALSVYFCQKSKKAGAVPALITSNGPS